ncbi:hypothetical protein [Actinomadura decatromicini]|uniref:Histidine kinase/HSP90-like ATPase domain-containing protein n=1 Tax=Actinomadura decatromicini TaxID=2604572 RepID=A0A5D3FX22_9ACTN|nr:hypothetical protein [Actinomadura decatromicini]TYK52456.1 hypothetical protein FXF68_01345 [Actinomadura decatromicini]
MAAFVRVFMVVFLVIPLFGWHKLVHPWLAVLALLAAAAEAAYVARRLRATKRIKDDVRLAVVDVAFCIILMAVGSQAAAPHDRNVIMTEVIPFSLIASLILAFAIGLRVRSLLAILVLWGSWCLALLPDAGLKLGSDLLGFVMWFVVGLYVATQLRSMAAETAKATAAAREAEAKTAKATAAAREAKAKLERERLFRDVHNDVAGIFDLLAVDMRLPEDARDLAASGGRAARNMLRDVHGDRPAFHDRLMELTSRYRLRGMLVHPRFHIDDEPPDDVADVVLGAAAAALANTRRHSGPAPEATFFAAFDSDGVLIVSVIDEGTGFDVDSVRTGGGLGRLPQAVRDIGGSWEIRSAPGEGTQVHITWPAEEEER